MQAIAVAYAGCRCARWQVRLLGFGHAGARLTADADACAGGIWGSVFAANPARNIVLRPLCEANCAEVTVEIPPDAITAYGEQAGLFLYADDSNYCKVVVEGMKDGSTSIVMAIETDGVPKVVEKVPIDRPSGECVKVSLRLELPPSPTGEVVALQKLPYCFQMIGRCPATPGSRIGFGAHGSRLDESAAHVAFQDFSLIRIAEDRVSW